MERQISMASRRELIRSIGTRYRAGSRAAKRCILDEFVAVTGCHRKHAIRLLKSSDPKQPAALRARARRYGDAVGEALVLLWEASDRVCSKRLKPLIPAKGEVRGLIISDAQWGRMMVVRSQKRVDSEPMPEQMMFF